MPVGRRFITSLPHPDHHLEAWDYLAQNVKTYPDGLNVQPYRKPRYDEAPKPLGTLQLSRVGQLSKGGGGLLLRECIDGQDAAAIITRDVAGSELLARTLFTERHRKRLMAFGNGRQAEFRLFLDHFGRDLLRMGYTIHVLGSLMSIKALKVSKSRHVWWLCDAETLTGVPLGAINAQISLYEPANGHSGTYCERLYRWLSEVQGELATRFGVALNVTVGRTAAMAAARHVPDEVWVWRPSPTVIAMCRLGGGFRGGYYNAADYEGPAWRIDVRRQYTAALRSELPYAVAYGPWSETGKCSRGIFMCTVQGTGKTRILLNVWDSISKTFTLQRWNGRECIAIIPSAEFEGIAALGFAVLPGWGFVFCRTFNLASYVDQLQALTDIHGADSTLGQVCKALGNCVWGKWAAPPERTDIAYADHRPGKDWSPMQRDTGDDIENLWTATRTSYNAMQHIELATVVTAVARNQCYLMMGQLIDQGFLLAQVYVDSITIEGAAPAHPPPEQVPIGQWRYEGFDPHAVVWNTGAGSFGQKSKGKTPTVAAALRVRAINGHSPEERTPEAVPVPRLRWTR